MDEFAGRLLAGRYRLPRPSPEDHELCEAVAYDTASGQEVLVRQVPLPEVVDAEVLGEPGTAGWPRSRATREPGDPAVRRAVDAALAAARIPDHPRLDQVFDVFVEDDGLWIVSELVAGRTLAAVIADGPLTPHRAAEIAADLLAGLSAVHTYGWTHRNITARSVLVCDDGRALLTGLASGAAEEALCGYDPLPTEGPMAPDVDEPSPEQPARDSGPGPGPGFEPEERPRPEPEPEPERRRAQYGPWGGDKPGPAAHRSPLPPLPPEYTYAEAGRDAGHDDVPHDAYAEHDAYGVPYGDADTAPDVWGEPEPEPWSEPVTPGRYRGPETALAAERARQARMTTVGPVTERWAPEQAGPVHENWRLAPPVGPAADLWAVGALLYRAVQGHAPYPEDSVPELVQMVCAEPPAFAEECGPLRPVIESLLRQDPTERPQFEELCGWLRSLIRSAPEPDAGRNLVTAHPSLTSGRRTDPRRLPILRLRGELVRRRRTEKRPVPVPRSRHRGGRSRRPRSPRRLGLLLLGAVLLGLVSAVTAAALLMPPADPSDRNRPGSVGEVPGERPREEQDPPPGSPEPGASEDAEPPEEEPEPGQSSETPQSGEPDGEEQAVPDGYVLHRDPAGFQIAVPEGWTRGRTSNGQVRFSQGALQLVVVPGRDGTGTYGTDPREYQLADEPELADYRESTAWKTVSGVRSITVGDTAMAEGEFVWESGGRRTLVRNRAMLLGSKYHVVLVRGPEDRRAEIDAHFSQVVDTYRATG
ncbi:serine/threonine protein kinase [Streptomyces sp. JJ38]|uniref:serine/threonine protein kinase n=1 Tax=Streptomyces sp. JJ38 TaxID=2738128 RepID=UPI001C57461F|nr:serine/threonine protein kinase [Streptomyces sp. JJ38]MBW1596965.1 serine/threonine protein kinase [Streptomyces sp. JJ38]